MVENELPDEDLPEFTDALADGFIAAGLTDINSLIDLATDPEGKWILYPQNKKLVWLLEVTCRMDWSCPFKFRLVCELKKRLKVILSSMSKSHLYYK